MGFTTPLSRYPTHLESVLGPLTTSEDVAIRAVLASCDQRMVALARLIGQPGGEREHVSLTMSESGQASLGASTGTAIGGDGARCVELGVRVYPSWHYGERTGTWSWVVELEVDADCQHTEDHGYMHRVLARERVITRSALEAATALSESIDELTRLATTHPIEHWLALASESP